MKRECISKYSREGMVGLVLNVAFCAGAMASAPANNPTGLVDALNGVFGKQTTGRAIHAKGIVLEGTFTPARSAATLTKAAHLNGGTIPVTVRFSDFAGIPTVSDVDALATPRGMALKFSIPGGGTTDVVAHSFNGFPTKTAEEFRQLLIAIGTSPPGTASPTPAQTYMGAHPKAQYFFEHLPSPPVSFATLPYFGVNSFAFTDGYGKKRFGRYQLIPSAGTKLLSKDEVAHAQPGYLNEEIRRRVATESVEFTLQVQLAGPGDPIDDPSVTWPDARPVTKLGVVKVMRVVPESDAAERGLLFTPTAVVDGIETADPMLEARNAAYGVSYARRH